MTAPNERIFTLDNPIRDYAWGSPTYIPQLLGREVTGRPAAEMWVGAHPGSPSRWQAHPDRIGLDAVIDGAPEELLGAASVQRFGPRLPFLLKILAADRALSLQVHPDTKQARAGFQAEQAAGTSLNALERNYSDPFHKPELAYALTDFEAFCGFRPIEQTRELLAALSVAELEPYRDLLVGEDGLRAAFTCLLTLPEPARGRVVAATLSACQRLAGGGGPWAAQARASVLAGTDFPGDIGAVLALLLNYVRLRPGEAIYLGAGNVHAYLRGACIEVLANSDNVLRCGLTGKHVDIPELLRIADFHAMAQPRWEAAPGSPTSFVVPVADFMLTVLEAADLSTELPGSQPHLVLCGEGSVVVSHGQERVSVPAWHAVFVAAGPGTVSVQPTERAFIVASKLSR